MNSTYRDHLLRQLGIKESQIKPSTVDRDAFPGIDPEDIKKDGKKEKKEHPQLSKADAELVAAQHLKKEPQNEGFLSPTAKGNPVVMLAIRGSSTGGLPSQADQCGDISPSKVGGYDKVTVNPVNSKIVNKTPSNPDIKSDGPIVDDPQLEGGVTHPHQVQRDNGEPPQAVTGASVEDSPLTLKSAIPHGLDIEIPEKKEPAGEEPNKEARDEESKEQLTEKKKKNKWDRVCYHCKQERPCKCDKADDEERELRDKDPEKHKKLFGMKIDKKDGLDETFKRHTLLMKEYLGINEILDDDETMCSACNGSGEGPADGTKCSTCHGSGVIKHGEEEDPDYHGNDVDESIKSKHGDGCECNACLTKSGDPRAYDSKRPIGNTFKGPMTSLEDPKKPNKKPSFPGDPATGYISQRLKEDHSLPQVKEPNFAYCVGCGQKMPLDHPSSSGQHKVCDKCKGYKSGEKKDKVEEQQRINESYAAPFQRMRGLADIIPMSMFENKSKTDDVAKGAHQADLWAADKLIGKMQKDPKLRPFPFDKDHPELAPKAKLSFGGKHVAENVGATEPFVTTWKMDKEKAGMVKTGTKDTLVNEEKWMQDVSKNAEQKGTKGALRKDLGVPEDKTIPDEKLESLKDMLHKKAEAGTLTDKESLLSKRVNAALNMRNANK